MPKTSMVMVYTATTEADVARQYAKGNAEAELQGYVPTSEVWDRNTLTVTYQYRGVPARVSLPAETAAESKDEGLRQRLRHRLGLG
jgi:hypothetical protein